MNDFFGMNEIDKIQEEIEKDLMPKIITETTSNVATETPYNIQPEQDEHTNFSLVTQEDNTALRNLDYPEFYRETIKTAPKKSLLKTAVILFFVCTIGMGTLGFGIGAGIVYLRNSGAGISSEEQGNDSDVRFASNSYTFESVEPVVVGLSDVVELLSPSVVGITTYRDEREFPFGGDVSHGSGIIFADNDDKIFIATNLHVVRMGESWDITIEGNGPVSAYPVDSNSTYDLAVVYVYKDDLMKEGINPVTFATFGNSDDMRIGDVVLAIGNAMGEGTSVTRGIISASEREIYIPGRENPIKVLQTDAAINYGNSGGPLINTLGEIVGININHSTGLRADTIGVEGMGYSISSNIAAPILQEIVDSYPTPAIGITGVSLSEDPDRMAERWGIPELGVRVVTVQKGRPADLAGILEDDVITTFDGLPVFDMPQLIAAIREKEIGDIVEVKILRGGSFAITVQMELAKMIRDTF